MMDRRTLSKIDEGLDSSEVAELCFLCRDFVSKRRLENIKDGKDLFLRLEEKGLLQNDAFLRQLLDTIHRADLLRDLETDSRPPEETDASPVLSDYRKTLYSIYNGFTKENFERLKFLLTDRLGRRQIELSKTPLDVFAEMEKANLLSETDVASLHEALQELDQELAIILENYTQRVRQPRQQFMLPPDVSMDIERTHEPLSITETQPNYRRDSINTDAQLITNPTSLPDQSEYYTLTRIPRGLCVVFNNEIFTGGLNNRRGTQKDADTLTEVFTDLGFKVKIRNNFTADQMKKELDHLRRNDFTNHDALVVCVLSHGEKGCVFGTDGKKVLLKELTDPFTSRQAPALTGKPKLFFIQACQGDEYQRGYYPSSLGPGENENQNKETWQADDSIPDEAVPELADFLMGMATVEEFRSFRNTLTGSIYIQELCRQLKIAAESQAMDDILTVLTRVNREVSKGEFLSHKQMPQPKYTLTKKLVLKFV